jgi:hypothetical protein
LVADEALIWPRLFDILKQIPRRTTISTPSTVFVEEKCPNKTFNQQREEASQRVQSYS